MQQYEAINILNSVLLHLCHMTSFFQSLFCSTKLHLFDQKYSEVNNIAKYYKITKQWNIIKV